MSASNVELARRSWDLPRHPELLEELYSPDLVWHESDQDVRGYDGAREFISGFVTGFPDITATVEDVFGDGDKVCTRWTLRGTHRGEFAGLSPTNRTVTMTGMTVHRIADGRIVEEWDAYDNLSLMQQVGAVPQPRASQEA